jgi:colanic acid biosynthesis protein WcaH
MAQKLPPHDFEQIIKNGPLVSIDLVVRTKDGKLLLGLRSNEPAKGCFFVPGGRIFKDENFEEAFSRITEEELGVKMNMTEAHSLGVNQHFYPTNAVGTPGFGTHYVVLAYELLLDEEIPRLPKNQHSEYQWMTAEQALSHPMVHSNSKEYLRMGIIRCESQYQLVSARRTSQDTMLWQTPALLFTGESFLFSVVANPNVEPVVKFVVSFFGLFVSFAALQLFVKHRILEESNSRRLEQFEVNNSHKGFARLHSRMTIEDSKCTSDHKNNESEPWHGLARMGSFEVWRTVLVLSMAVFLGFTIFWGINSCK